MKKYIKCNSSSNQQTPMMHKANEEKIHKYKLTYIVQTTLIILPLSINWQKTDKFKYFSQELVKHAI